MVTRTLELAPRLCDGCAEYHIRFAITRFGAPREKSILLDRKLIIERIREILAEQSGRSQNPLQIVIAGAADTGVLATCAHAAATLGDTVKARCQFIVIDRCPTPLALCEAFAGRHGLRLRTIKADLLSSSEPLEADLIVVHSFLRFIERDRQASLLETFDHWLKPLGRIIVSQSIRPKTATYFHRECRRLDSELAAVKAAITAGQIKLTPEIENMLEGIYGHYDHLRRQGDLGSVDDLRALLREADLHEQSFDVISRELATSEEETISRVRAIAVLGSTRDA